MFASKGGIVLNKKGICGKIVKKKCVLEIDIMNRNTIISLAMLYATWQTKHKDILDLLPRTRSASCGTEKQYIRFRAGIKFPRC